MGGKRVDCMTPQKAIRTDLFIWSSAAIVSSIRCRGNLHDERLSLDGLARLRAFG